MGSGGAWGGRWGGGGGKGREEDKVGQWGPPLTFGARMTVAEGVNIPSIPLHSITSTKRKTGTNPSLSTKH